MAGEYDSYAIKKKYVHTCTLPKGLEAIDEVIPDEYFIRKKIRKFCLISTNVAHRRIYAKSTRVLEKERTYHLLNHFYLIHPFSDFFYYWEILMLLINFTQLVLTPVLIINRIRMDAATKVILATLIVGNINIFIRFITGYYRYDIKEVMLEPKQIAWHYFTTLLIPDFIGNFPLRSLLSFLDVNLSVVMAFKLAIAFNAVNFIKCMDGLREKRDMDLVIVKLVSSFAITGIGLLWITALCSLAANIDQNSNKSSMWWSIYLNFIILTGTSVNEFTFVGCEVIVKTIALAFGFIMRNVILVQLIIFFKTYIMNNLNRSSLLLELNEFCYLKKLPLNLRQKIFKYYEFKFQNVYYNEMDIWTLLSESMRQNILDYDSKQWFEGDIFKLCPLVLRQLISITLDKEIFLKGDIIYSQAYVLSRIYFIKTGTVILYDDEGKLAHVIHEGNFFSEKALLLKEGMRHMYKAVACEDCQLFALKKAVFQRIIKAFPDEYNVILDILTRRHKYLLRNKRITKRLKLDDYYLSDQESDTERK